VADVWKENVMENLEMEILEFETVEKILEVIKKNLSIKKQQGSIRIVESKREREVK